MREPTAAAARLQAVLAVHRGRVGDVLERYGASNPRIFGSVARGDAREDSDLDLLVDLVPGAGNELLRVAGLAEDLSELLGVRVDVVAPALLRHEVSATALTDAVPVAARACHGPRSRVFATSSCTSTSVSTGR